MNGAAMLGNLLHRRVELRARDPEELGEYYGSVWGFDVEDNAVLIMSNVEGQLAMLHSSATFWKHMFQLDIILENGLWCTSLPALASSDMSPTGCRRRRRAAIRGVRET